MSKNNETNKLDRSDRKKTQAPKLLNAKIYKFHFQNNPMDKTFDSHSKLKIIDGLGLLGYR